jgi:two-component system response regulator YesN
MYSLLLVDDELLILDGLYNNIDWEESGFSNVYRASSAEAALEIMRKYRIDVVVTDISMPGMDGIDMCRHIKESWPLCRVIFLSGYRDFDYARRAVEMGVYQYLVKPVRYEDIQDTVKGALAELESAMEQSDLLSKAREKMESMGELLKERFLNGWLVQGLLDPVSDTEQARAAGLNLDRNAFGFAMLMELESSGAVLHSGVWYLALQELAERYFSGYDQMICLPTSEKRLLLVMICADAQRAQTLREQSANRLDAFQFSVDKSLGQSLSIYLSEVEPPETMHAAYLQLRYDMDREQGLPGGRIVMVPRREEAELENAELFETLFSALAAADEAALVGWIDGFCQKIERSSKPVSMSRLMVTMLTGALSCDAMGRRFGDDEWERQCDELFFARVRMLPLDELRRICMEAVRGYCDWVKERQSSRQKGIVEAVRLIISEKMEQGITVNAIAGEMHYNAGYLSHIVKEQTGQTLGDLLISMRMERACRLLSAGEKVMDTAMAVGYDNLAHFSRTFKRRIGVSPRQYV